MQQIMRKLLKKDKKRHFNVEMSCFFILFKSLVILVLFGGFSSVHIYPQSVAFVNR